MNNSSEAQHQESSGSWEKLVDAARVLGVSEITLRRRIKSGRLKHEFQAGKYLVFVPHGVNPRQFLEGQPQSHGGGHSGANHGGGHGLTRPVGRSPILGPYAMPVRAAEAGGLGESRDSQELEERVAALTQSVEDLTQRLDDQAQKLQGLQGELAEKRVEIEKLQRELTDQVTLNAALEAALEESGARG